MLFAYSSNTNSCLGLGFFVFKNSFQNIADFWEIFFAAHYGAKNLTESWSEFCWDKERMSSH